MKYHAGLPEESGKADLKTINRRTSSDLFFSGGGRRRLRQNRAENPADQTRVRGPRSTRSRLMEKHDKAASVPTVRKKSCGVWFPSHNERRKFWPILGSDRNHHGFPILPGPFYEKSCLNFTAERNESRDGLCLFINRKRYQMPNRFEAPPAPRVSRYRKSFFSTIRSQPFFGVENGYFWGGLAFRHFSNRSRMTAS